LTDNLQISFDAEQVLRYFARLPPATQTAVKQGVERGLILAESAFRMNPGVRLSGSRSGLGSRLTHFVATGGDMAIVGAVGFRKTALFPYELSQEFGANAHKGAMAIPISPEAKAMSKRGDSARDFPRKLHLIKGMGKALLIEHVMSAGGRGGGASVHRRSDVHYVLKKSLRPRMRFRETMRNQAGQISDQIVQSVRAAKDRI
jgi:hypothetical protein